MLQGLGRVVFRGRILVDHVVPVRSGPRYGEYCHYAFGARVYVSPVAGLFIFSGVFPTCVRAAGGTGLSVGRSGLSIVSVVRARLGLSRGHQRRFYSPGSFTFRPIPVSFIRNAASRAIGRGSSFCAFVYFLSRCLLCVLPRFVIPSGVVLCVSVFLHAFRFLSRYVGLLFAVYVGASVVVVYRGYLSNLRVVRRGVPRPIGYQAHRLRLPIVGNFLLPSRDMFRLAFGLLYLGRLVLIVVLPCSRV